MNRRALAEKAFTEVYHAKMYHAQPKFIQDLDSSYIKGEETDETLRLKGQRLQELMKEGIEFHAACDHPEIYVGSIDAQFLYDTFVLKTNTGSYEDWIFLRLLREAKNFIENSK